MAGPEVDPDEREVAMAPGAPFRGWCGQRGEMRVSRQLDRRQLNFRVERRSAGTIGAKIQGDAHMARRSESR